MRIIYLIFYLSILFVAQINVQIKIEELRLKENLNTRYLFQPDDAWKSILAGGFRGLIADLLWIKADEYSHHGQWYKLFPIFKMVTFLQPKFITAWSVGGWHMAFNMHFYSRTQEEKIRWLEEGLRFLKEGIRNNSDRYDLYFDLGWIYFYKLNDYPNAIRYLKRAVDLPHPQFVDHLLAHAYEKDNQLEKAFAIWEKLQVKNFREKTLERVVNREVTRLSEKIKTRRKTIDSPQ